MAKPDLDDGWVKLAHELLAAILVGSFSKRAGIVLREVFEQIYGPAKRRTADLYPPEIASRSGVSRSHVWDAIRELIRDGVIEESPEGSGSYRFLKDYESWRIGSKPRFTPKEVIYIRSAPDRAGIWSVVRPRRISSDRPQTGTVRGPVPSRFGDGARPGTVPVEGRSHIEERASERILSSREEIERSVVPSEHTQEACVCVTDASGSVVPIAPTEAPDLAELARVSDLAERLFPMAGWDLEVGRWSALYPLPWIARALEVAAAGGKAVRWTYVLAILRRWQAEGGPEAPTVAARPSANGNGAGKHAAIDRMGDWVPPSLRGKS